MKKVKKSMKNLKKNKKTFEERLLIKIAEMKKSGILIDDVEDDDEKLKNDNGKLKNDNKTLKNDNKKLKNDKNEKMEVEE